jgi:hypothetical protein
MDTLVLEPQNRLERLVTRYVESLQPSPARIRLSVSRLQRTQPHLSAHALAEHWSERVCRRYAAEGAATALPAVIPGLGTSAQLALEGGTIAADLTYMLHCMADIVMGVGHIFGREVEHPFNEEFVRVLGIWCGALSLGKEAARRVGTKVATAPIKHLPGELFKRLNPRVGEGIVANLGIRRGSIALGRLIPFGIGALVSGGFNYATMRGFKKTTIEYYAVASHT